MAEVDGELSASKDVAATCDLPSVGGVRGPFFNRKIPLLVGRIWLGVLGLCPLEAAPVDDVTGVLQKFLDQPSYTWSTTSSRGMPEATAGSGGQDMVGQHEMGGLTKIFANGGREDRWAAITDETDFWSGRWIFQNETGWHRLSDMQFRPGTESARVRGGGSIPDMGRRSAAGIMTILLGSNSISGDRKWGLWRPDLEVAVIVDSLAKVEAMGNGLYEAELTEEGATKLLGRPAAPGVVQIRVENAQAKIKLWVRQRSLVRYELAVEGVQVATGGRRRVSYTLVRDLKDFGTTKIELPKEAKVLLE